MEWKDHQEWESGWWGDCTNTFAEETKQISYAYRMGLVVVAHPDERWPVYDLEGKNVADFGGGPTSMLLKCKNRGQDCVVVDPCDYPHWVAARYDTAGVRYARFPAEEFVSASGFDEVWMYNVLQHVIDPKTIIENALNCAPVVRLFEWLNILPCNGHPHTLREYDLNDWLQGTGTVEQMAGENACWGTAYYFHS